MTTRSRQPIKCQGASRRWRGGDVGEPAPKPVSPTLEVEGPWLLDSRDVARLLKIGRTKAFDLMGRGDLPVVRIGRCIRVPRRGLAIWIANQTQSVGDAVWPPDSVRLNH